MQNRPGYIGPGQPSTPGYLGIPGQHVAPSSIPPGATGPIFGAASDAVPDRLARQGVTQDMWDETKALHSGLETSTRDRDALRMANAAQQRQVAAGKGAGAKGSSPAQVADVMRKYYNGLRNPPSGQGAMSHKQAEAETERWAQRRGLPGPVVQQVVKEGLQKQSQQEQPQQQQPQQPQRTGLFGLQRPWQPAQPRQQQQPQQQQSQQPQQGQRPPKPTNVPAGYQAVWLPKLNRWGKMQVQ